MTPLARAAIPLVIGGVIALVPAPAGLAEHAWLYFAVFAAGIAALITEPMSAGSIGMISITLVAITRLPFSPAQLADPAFKAPAEAIKWALSGFANGTVWLIFSSLV